MSDANYNSHKDKIHDDHLQQFVILVVQNRCLEKC